MNIQTALVAKPATWADPLEVFVARAEARAILYREGEYTLHEAVELLQEAAAQYGLVDEIGQDHVQAVIAAAFVTVRADTDADVVPDLERADVGNLGHDQGCGVTTLKRGAAAQSTIDAAEYLARLGNAGRLRAWLKLHSTQERSAIRKHLEAM